MSIGYRLSRRASREFDAIIEYRRQVAGDLNAQRLESDLIDAFGLIASQPKIGSQRTDLSGGSYRFWLKEGYWIVYQLRGTASPLIVAIIDGRRDIARLLR